VGLLKSYEARSLSARLTYSKVAKMIAAEPEEQGVRAYAERYASIVSHIDDFERSVSHVKSGP